MTPSERRTRLMKEIRRASAIEKASANAFLGRLLATSATDTSSPADKLQADWLKPVQDLLARTSDMGQVAWAHV
ncbi:hypothetical protein D9M68_974650 [compost metagenome]